MSELINQVDEFFKIIKSLGTTANIMISPAYSKIDAFQFQEPLRLKWGYLEDTEGLDEFFVYVVSTFESPIAWTLEPFIKKANFYPNGFVKWWLLYPSKVESVVKQQNLSHESAINWLRENEPEFGIKTNEEFYNFVRHLDACYNDWIKKGKLKPIDQ